MNIGGVLGVLNYITGCVGNFGGFEGFREEFCFVDRTGGGREHGYLDGFEQEHVARHIGRRILFFRTRDCRKQHRILLVIFASVDTFQDHNLKIAMKLEFFLSLQMLTAWWQSAGQRTFTGALLLFSLRWSLDTLAWGF